MAAEPVNIFSHTKDLAGIAAVLRQMAPEAKVTGPDDAWDRITITGAKSWFRKAPTVIFKHRAEYYTGPDWPQQLAGMQGYFARFPESPRKADVFRLIRSFRFALTMEFEPDLEAGDDARLKFVFAVVRHLDGVLFTPESLRDAAGRELISALGEGDPAATLPAIPPEPATAVKPGTPPASTPAAAAPASPAKKTRPPAPEKKPAPAPVVEEKAPSVDPRRVARRALCLAAVAGRGLLELEKMPPEKAETRRKSILTWTGELALEDELEPEELKLLQQSVGGLEEQAAVDAVWRLEGLGVLAWALGRFEVPAYDKRVDPGALLAAVGFLDSKKAAALAASPAVKPPEKLQHLQTQCFALHWRLRDFQLKKKKLNFRTFARDCWFGPLDVSLARFCDHDLAIGDVAIGNAPEDEVRKAASAANERHLAINWLADGGDVYSKTDTAT